MELSPGLIALVAISFLAAFVNGALGYGFSSLTVPVGLVFFANRLFQAAGLRRPIRAEKRLGLPFEAGLGFLYSVTTISGPPLALLFNNQGLVKHEFRAGLALIRVAERSWAFRSARTSSAAWTLRRSAGSA